MCNVKKLSDKKIQKTIRTRCILLMEFFPREEFRQRSPSFSIPFLLCCALFSNKLRPISDDLGAGFCDFWTKNHKIFFKNYDGSRRIVKLPFLKKLGRDVSF